MLGKDFVILWCCNTRSLLVRLQLNDKNLDVTADGWILERLSAQNLRFAGPIQSLGIKLGVLIGFPGFMLLESKFAWVTLPNYFLAMSVMLLISLIVIVFLVAETVSGKSKDIELKGFDELETKSMVDGQFELTPWTIFKCLLKGAKLVSSEIPYFDFRDYSQTKYTDVRSGRFCHLHTKKHSCSWSLVQFKDSRSWF